MKIDARRSTLLVIDFQTRLMPAIDGAAEAVSNATKLVTAATLLDIPTLFTEQNPKGLGGTLEAFGAPPDRTIVKLSFDATQENRLTPRLAPDHALVLVGAEAHVCVLQTALGLLGAGRRVFVVADAVGSRKPESKRLGLARAEKNGADIVTTEMVLFEWLGDARHPRFKAILALVK